MAEVKRPSGEPSVPAIFKDSFFVGEKGTTRKACQTTGFPL